MQLLSNGQLLSTGTLTPRAEGGGVHLQQLNPALQVPNRQLPVFRGGDVSGVHDMSRSNVLLLDCLHLMIQVRLLPLQHANLPVVPE